MRLQHVWHQGIVCHLLIFLLILALLRVLWLIVELLTVFQIITGVMAPLGYRDLYPLLLRKVAALRMGIRWQDLDLIMARVSLGSAYRLRADLSVMLISLHCDRWRLLALDLLQYQVVWRILVIIILELLRTRVSLSGALG